MKVRYTILLLCCLAGHITCMAQLISVEEKDSLVSALYARSLSSRQKDNNAAFPDFSFLYNGKMITRQSLTGKTVLVQVWPDRQMPVQADLQVMNELYNSLKKYPGFDCIAFSGGPADSIAAVCNRLNIAFKVIPVPNEECLRLNNHTSGPGSFILDGQGTVRFRKKMNALHAWKITGSLLMQLYPVINELLYNAGEQPHRSS